MWSLSIVVRRIDRRTLLPGLVDRKIDVVTIFRGEKDR